MIIESCISFSPGILAAEVTTSGVFRTRLLIWNGYHLMIQIESEYIFFLFDDTAVFDKDEAERMIKFIHWLSDLLFYVPFENFSPNRDVTIYRWRTAKFRHWRVRLLDRAGQHYAPHAVTRNLDFVDCVWLIYWLVFYAVSTGIYPFNDSRSRSKSEMTFPLCGTWWFN